MITLWIELELNFYLVEKVFLSEGYSVIITAGAADKVLYAVQLFPKILSSVPEGDELETKWINCA